MIFNSLLDRVEHSVEFIHIEDSFEGCFKYFEIWANILGFNVFDPNYGTLQYKHKGRFIFFVATLIQSTSSGFYHAFDTYKDNLEDQLSSLIAAFFALMIDMKLVIVCSRYKYFCQLKRYILDKTQNNKDPVYNPILNEYLRYTRIIMKVITVLYYQAVIVINIYPIIMGKPGTYPLNFAIPGIPSDNIHGYITNYIYISACTFFAGTFFIGFDVFIATATFFLASRFELCGTYFNKIGTNQNASNDESRKLIETGIALHVETLKFYKTLKKIMQPLVFCECSIVIILICIQMLLILVNPFNQAYLSFLGTIVQVFLYCSVGELIAIKAFEVSTKLYSSKWYNVEDVKLKRLLIVILNRTQNPTYFALGDLFPFCMETFGTIIGAGFKAFNVLKSTMK